MAGIPSRSIEAVYQNSTPAISFTASSVDNLSRISLILALAKSEGGMDYSAQTRSVRHLLGYIRARSVAPVSKPARQSHPNLEHAILAGACFETGATERANKAPIHV